MTETEMLAFVDITDTFMASFPRNTCISRTRLFTEGLHRIGVASRALPVQWVVTAIGLKFVYVSGLSEASEAAARKAAQNFITGYISDDSWKGHVIAVVDERWLVDLSFDDAFRALHTMDPQLPERVGTFIAPLAELNGAPLGDMCEVEAVISDDERRHYFKVQYYGSGDYSFLAASAWELDYLERAIDRVVELYQQRRRSARKPVKKGKA